MNSPSLAPWGYLEPINAVYPRRTLTEPSYTAGRHLWKCDIIFDVRELRQHKYYTRLSARHFVIECIPHDRTIYFHDISRNGSYIDGEFVRQSRVPLENNEHIISLVSKENRAYRFIRLSGLFNAVSLDQRLLKANLLGSGSFANVYKAISSATQTRRAIKIVNRELCERQIGPDFYKYLNREVSIHGIMEHPCILRRFDVVQEKTNLFVEMEFAAGGSLLDRIRQTILMSEDECKFIFYQLACALAYLHRQKIVHRDIKPANVLLMSTDKETIAKVSDFGLAKYMTAPTKNVNATIAGTHRFMAPEVLLQTGYSTNTDVWSFGMTLLNAYIGETIFHLRGVLAVATLHPSKRDFKVVLLRTLERNRFTRPEVFQLFRYAWFRDIACWERIQKLVYAQTGGYLSIPNER